MKTAEYEITAAANSWEIRSALDGRVVSTHPTRVDAIAQGRQLATTFLILGPGGRRQTEEELLLEFWDANLCPTCESAIPEGTRVGSGKKARGGFCSLTCYYRYYNVDLRGKAGVQNPS